jgi:exodeoxyribonuclease V gamma subunit
MRSVPHRVVCLLGLDDGVFPRKAPRDGDDLMLASPLIGERDPRAEDRQLLLDALLAAEDKLIITYAGRDERTNASKPPAIPVGELLDLLEDDHVTEHPLQPFDPRNFDAAAPLSFDRATLAGAEALRRPRVHKPPFLDGPLPGLEEDLIELDDLVRFAEHPVRGFLRRRLGLELRDFTEEVEDGLPIELGGLERYDVGQRLLAARLAGVDERAAREAERRSGHLPPGALGTPVLDRAMPLVEALRAEAGDGEASAIDVRIELPDGRRLRGTVPGVCDRTLRTVTFATLAARHRIDAWVRLLALCADDPDAGYHARTIGKAGQGIAVREIPPLTDAVPLLADLVALYDRGLREPLPLAPKTSAAYVQTGHPAARKEWETQFMANGDRWEKEAVEAEYVQVFGHVLSYDELSAMPDYDALAHALWDPIREHEA